MAMSKREQDVISTVFRSAVDELVIDHYDAETQEHQLSSRIGQRIEDEFNRTSIFRDRFIVSTQDIPDKGKGSLEGKTGIDLYMSITYRDDEGFSKAFLVQSKWDTSSDRHGLKSQCQKMIDISSSSYVWVYGPSGVIVVPAQSAAKRVPSSIKGLRGAGLDDLINDVLVCRAGDPTLAVPDVVNRRGALSGILREINAKSGVDFQIVNASRDEVTPIALDQSRFRGRLG